MSSVGMDHKQAVVAVEMIQVWVGGTGHIFSSETWMKSEEQAGDFISKIVAVAASP